MNERIKELAEQAENYAYSVVIGGDECQEAYTKKFAELIVRECAELCLKHETFLCLFNEMEYRKGRHFNTIIKEHFGVEQ